MCRDHLNLIQLLRFYLISILGSIHKVDQVQEPLRRRQA